jgi:hypothetical protein
MIDILGISLIDWNLFIAIVPLPRRPDAPVITTRLLDILQSACRDF